MKISIFKLYQYIFSDWSNIEKYVSDDLAKIANSATTRSSEGKEASTTKTLRVINPDDLKQRLLAKRKKEITEFFFGKKDKSALIDVATRPAFRAALRSLKANALENILFGNTTDDVVQEYAFPNDINILKPFLALNQEHHFLKEETSAASAAFIKFFKIAKIIGDFIEKNNDEENTTATEHAFKLFAVFYQDPINVLKPVDEYLRKFINSEQPLHDALIYSIPTPDEIPALDLAGWQKFISHFGPPAFQLFNNATVIQSQLESGKAPETIAQAKEAAAKKQFMQYYLFPELAELCVQYGLNEEIFNSCLDIRFPGLEKINHTLSPTQRLQQAKEIELKATDNLPDVVIEGNSLGYANYCLVKLPKHDPRAYLLGQITNCCQSIGGMSETCVVDGITLENNGFYVLLKQKVAKLASLEEKARPNSFIQVGEEKEINYATYDIVGQGYAWRSKHGNIVFDSWENRTPGRDDAVIVALLNKYSELITSTSGAPMRVTIGTGGKTPKAFQKHPHCAETMLMGIPYSDSTTQTMIYCNEERRKPFVAELNIIIEKLFAGKTADALFKDKKGAIYDWIYGDYKTKLSNWICNGYSESYFENIKSYLLTTNVDLTTPLLILLQCHGVQTLNALPPDEVILKTINEMHVLKAANLDSTLDVMKAVMKNVHLPSSCSATSISKAIQILIEAKLDQDKEIRSWLLERERWDFFVEKREDEHATYIVNAFHLLNEAGLENDADVRQTIFKGDDCPLSPSQIVADFAILKRAGLDKDADVRATVLLSHEKGTRANLAAKLEADFQALRLECLDKDADIRKVLLDINRGSQEADQGMKLVANLKKLKEKGMENELDIRRKVIYCTKYNGADEVMDAFQRLRDAKLEKETDIRNTIFLWHDSDNFKNCANVINAFKLLQENKLENEPYFRDSLCKDPKFATEIATNIITAINTLKTVKLDTDQEIRKSLTSYIYQASDKANHLIAALALIEKEELTSDHKLRQSVLNSIPWVTTETLEIYLATIKRLQKIGLADDDGIREALSYPRNDANKIVDAILQAYKIIQNANIPIDKELRYAIAKASPEAEKFSHNIVTVFEKMKSLKLEVDSAICKQIFLCCAESTKTAKKMLKSLAICQQSGVAISTDIRNTLFKNPGIALLQAKSIISHLEKTFPSVAAVNEQKEPDLIAKYKEAEAQLNEYIVLETKKQKELREMKTKDPTDRGRLESAIALKECLAVGGNITILRVRHRGFGSDYNLNQIYWQFKQILTATPNRLGVKPG